MSRVFVGRFILFVSVQVKDWVKERLGKFTPLSKQPQSVRDDLEKLQREVRNTHTSVHGNVRT